MAAARQRHFSLNSVVRLPPLDDSRDSGMENMATEVMHARTMPGDKDTVAFRLEIDVENAACGKRQREEFEWQSMKKGDKDPDAERGGFKLFQLDLEGEATGGENSVGTNPIQAETEGKAVAVLAWSKVMLETEGGGYLYSVCLTLWTAAAAEEEWTTGSMSAQPAPGSNR